MIIDTGKIQLKFSNQRAQVERETLADGTLSLRADSFEASFSLLPLHGEHWVKDNLSRSHQEP